MTNNLRDFRRRELMATRAKEADLCRLVNGVFTKERSHHLENGDVFMLLAILAVEGKLVLSSMEEAFRSLCDEYFSEASENRDLTDLGIFLRKICGILQIREDRLKNNNKRFSDKERIALTNDLFDRFLKAVSEIGPDLFYFAVKGRLRSPNPFGKSSENKSLSDEANQMFDSSGCALPKFLYIPFDFASKQDLSFLGNMSFISKAPRDWLAKELDKLESPCNSGDFKVAFKESYYRVLTDETSKYGKSLDTEEVYKLEWSLAKDDLEALRTAPNGDILLYASMNEALDALQKWDDKWGRLFYLPKTRDEFAGYLKRRKANREPGSPSKSDMWVITASPHKVKVKTATEMKIPFLAVITNDFMSGKDEILNAYNESDEVQAEKYDHNLKIEFGRLKDMACAKKGQNGKMSVQETRALMKLARKNLGPCPVRRFSYAGSDAKIDLMTRQPALREAFSCVAELIMLMAPYAPKEESVAKA